MKKVKSITINFFNFVSWPFGIWLCYTGRVGWWVFALIFVMGLECNVTWGKK